MNRGACISTIFFKRIEVIFFAAVLVVACGKSYTRPQPITISNYDAKYAGIFRRENTNDNSDASGMVSANFNSLSGLLEYRISWLQLSSLPISIRINDGVPVIIEINNFPARINGEYSSSAVLTTKQSNDLASNYITVTIITQKYSTGEITATLAGERQ